MPRGQGDVGTYPAVVNVLIRPFRIQDAAALADVMFASVHQAALRDHTPEQVAAWLPERPAVASMAGRASDGRFTLVACADDGRVVGYIDLEQDGHIDHFYCMPEAVGCGVGAKLYDAVERVAEICGLHKLFVEASEAARRLFEKKGFVLNDRCEWELRGVLIHNYAMSKDLVR
jgi:putative acetyltransferase